MDEIQEFFRRGGSMKGLTTLPDGTPWMMDEAFNELWNTPTDPGHPVKCEIADEK